MFYSLVAVLLLTALSAFAQAPIQGPVIVLIGAPGAGKTTQATALNKIYGLPVIGAEDLIRDNPGVFAKIRESKIKGIEPQTDPVLNNLFEERLKKDDTAQGFILAGYPATKDHADYLLKMIEQKRLPQPIIIQLDVPDAEVRKRLAGNSNYNTEQLDQLIKDYHREFDLLHLYFPKAVVTKIDGTASIDAVTQKIRAVLDPKIKAKK